MNDTRFHIGIDLGSISLKVVLLDDSMRVRFERWVRVAGQPLEALSALLRECADEFPGAELMSTGVTGSGRSLVAGVIASKEINEISAHAAAATALYPDIRTIIEIGGQDSKLIILGPATRDAPSGVTHFAMNELCAAGTGAFLDQQATRLGLSIEEFAALASDAREAAPIAGRCAVFAKTDMTHHQQEGRPLPDIVAGLNEALARSYLANLVRGRELPAPISFQGGVASNRGLVSAFKKLLNISGHGLVVPDNHKVMGAIGAAIIAARVNAGTTIGITEAAAKFALLARESCPRPETEGTRQRLEAPSSAPIEADFSKLNIDGIYLGIDVGSVSVKLAAIGPAGILYSDYRFSEGKPLDTLRAMLGGMKAGLPDLRLDGAGVTGSGRHFVGKLLFADVVQNEITAQARAAAAIMPGCDTVVEIGGQDAKFMRLKGLRPSHFAMNRVCAAGTGAFLQEQAARLEIDLEREFSELAFLSEHPAELGARCTVFMESDLVSHQQRGSSRQDLVAGLAMSVVANYREKVMQGHPAGERIIFLGGVARNRAVVSAIEATLGKEIRVALDGHISGAIGAALATMEARREGRFSKSSFSFEDAAMEFKQELCDDCPNRCLITTTAGAAAQKFGGRCGRWDSGAKAQKRSETSLLKQRNELLFGPSCHCEPRSGAAIPLSAGDRPATEPSAGKHVAPRAPRDDTRLRIGVPRAMFAYDSYPAWRTFFESIGCEVVLSPPTDSEILASGLKHLVVETCLPIKAFCSHLWWLQNAGVDFIFVPSLVITGKDAHDKETVHCPYVQGLAELARPIVSTPLLNPVINWKLDPRAAERAMAGVAVKLGLARKAGMKAWRAAVKEQARVQAALRKIGKETLARLARGEIKRAFVILGKDYNVNDGRLSLCAAELFESRGEVVLTQDMLVDDSGAYSAAYRTMYWSHSKEILAAARIASRTPDLHPVMITSFGCGPDSFTTGFLRDTMGKRPLLLLEVDEHSSAVGMETRIEAFLDSLAGAQTQVAETGRGPFIPPRGIRRVYMPNFSAHGHAFAAAVQSLGLIPKLTGLPDDESERLGALYAGNGECHPYVLMLGDYIKVARQESGSADACYYMPESGACRVGQFGTQMRLAAERAGVSLPIFTRIEDIVASAGKIAQGSHIKSLCAYWRMMRGMDFLMQMHLERRAYEVTPGSADNANARALDLLMRHIHNGKPLDGLAAARAVLSEVAVDRSRPRVKIGITGDYYTRICDFANSDLFREIERMGGVVMIPPTMTEFVKYESHQRTGAALRHKNVVQLGKALILRGLVDRLEREVQEIFTEHIDYDVPLDYERAKELIAPYIDMRLPGGLTGAVAAILEQLHAGANGIVSAITFHCTYGLVIGSVLARIDRDWPHVPKLTLIYEGLKPTHNRMRLEAFMERVWQASKPAPCQSVRCRRRSENWQQTFPPPL
ncbi:MAG: acyl-CoA dehydratase activase [bacterium]